MRRRRGERHVPVPAQVRVVLRPEHVEVELVRPEEVEHRQPLAERPGSAEEAFDDPAHRERRPVADDDALQAVPAAEQLAERLRRVELACAVDSVEHDRRAAVATVACGEQVATRREACRPLHAQRRFGRSVPADVDRQRRGARREVGDPGSAERSLRGGDGGWVAGGGGHHPDVGRDRDPRGQRSHRLRHREHRRRGSARGRARIGTACSKEQKDQCRRERAQCEAVRHGGQGNRPDDGADYDRPR